MYTVTPSTNRETTIAKYPENLRLCALSDSSHVNSVIVIQVCMHAYILQVNVASLHGHHFPLCSPVTRSTDRDCAVVTLHAIRASRLRQLFSQTSYDQQSSYACRHANWSYKHRNVVCFTTIAVLRLYYSNSYFYRFTHISREQTFPYVRLLLRDNGCSAVSSKVSLPRILYTPTLFTHHVG